MVEKWLNDPVNLVAFFIDCNCLPISVTGGGPGESGANPARWDTLIQRAFYNGWKSIHGLKYPTLDNAYGMTFDMHGPTSLRRNDLYVLAKSDINNRIAEIQLQAMLQFIIFGDSAYKTRSHTRSYYTRDDMRHCHRRWNSKLKSVRESIEWNYGYTSALFRYIMTKRKFKLMNAGIVSKVYIVATLLRNFHVALYGGQTSNYFGLDMPHDFLEHYINQTNFD